MRCQKKIHHSGNYLGLLWSDHGCRQDAQGGAPKGSWFVLWFARSGFLGSPVPGRKRFPSEAARHLGSTSPLVLQRFFHQQSHHRPDVHPGQLSPAHRSSTEQGAKPPGCVVGDLNGGAVKKRFASYIKFHLGGGDSRRNPPLARPGRHASPGSPAHCPRASQSPEPPPRLSRVSSVSSEGGTPQPGSSPLLLRRGFLDVSPVRRGFAEGSPSLSRRYVSPSPPQPPPRRLSESTSVPGSPQHRRMEHIRARFHYTPEPQRKLFGATDVQDI
ncbi:serine/arginine repetitive matrix protein 1-like [Bacillus rossius redtenbacheri]|uniref:serine/arginine repetitive matrix protein 1-like n=1 Tax=Bacillus rossius redtenbacheri TaxID=93214 RepID=UPI002FDEA67D